MTKKDPRPGSSIRQVKCIGWDSVWVIHSYFSIRGVDSRLRTQMSSPQNKRRVAHITVTYRIRLHIATVPSSAKEIGETRPWLEEAAGIFWHPRIRKA